MTLLSYKGMHDPTPNITMVKSMILLNNASDLFLYQAFLIFLEEYAFLLFSSLPVGSVHDFQDLSQAFIK